MRNLLMAGVAALALCAASPVLAQNADAGAAIGGSAGATTGAVAGGVVGGPVGAVIGGFAGAVIGSEVGVDAATVDYAVANPIEPIYVDGPVDLGYELPAGTVIQQIPSDPTYGYVYINNRVYIVDLVSKQIVQSPAYAVPANTITYVEANPSASVIIEGPVSAGYEVGSDVELVAIPEDPSYSYIYVNDRPALVDNSSRVIVWVK